MSAVHPRPAGPATQGPTRGPVGGAGQARAAERSLHDEVCGETRPHYHREDPDYGEQLIFVEDVLPAGGKCCLTPAELLRLDVACHAVVESFSEQGDEPWGCYLVGSAMTRPDYRDVDVRLILPDETFKRLTLDDPRVHRLLNVALSNLVDAAAGLRRPVDFQVQSMTEANSIAGQTARNPLGSRWSHQPPFPDAAVQPAKPNQETRSR
jgi:hypothetical protein